MFLKRSLLFFVLVFSTFFSNAQKKYFTIAEATNGMTTTLAPQAVKMGSWEPGTENFYEVVKDGEELWKKTSFTNKREDTFKVLYSLNYNLHDSLKNIPEFKWLNKKQFYFQSGNKIAIGNIPNEFSNTITWANYFILPENAENVFVEKNKLNCAYTVDNNLWIKPLNYSGDGAVQLTFDNDKNIVNGKSVHREEFGIDHGIFWSQKGNMLAYYKMDQTMVANYPIINWSVTPAINENIKYPMAGGISHQVTVCVYNLATKQTVVMETGEPKDHYLTCVTWSPDEKYVFIALLNRDQNELKLNEYDASTGKRLKTLFEEKNSMYVHPMHELSFLPGNNEYFIWRSERDGFDHMYLYNIDGKLIRQVTQGKWTVNELVGFNEKRKEIIYTSSQESPLEKHVYAANWMDGKIRRLDTEAGMHTVTASDDGEYLFDVCTGAGIPKKSMIRDIDGKIEKTLIDAPDPIAEYERPEIRNVSIRAADSTQLYGKLILPINFDSNKKYPVIVYLYNGPNVQLIHNSFPESGNLWYEYMAQKGYVIFSMDGRGSDNRGLAFEQSTFRKLGTVELEDQMKGVEFLKSLKYVDPGRMGIHGWSYGGFMTTSMMLKHPGVFKCAVAGGPVMDWKMYEVMYTERYMDTPQNNPEGYENANLLSKVKNLKGKLLLIHGTNDNVVVWQHSIKFLKKCVDENVQVDYFVYPGYEHNVRGKDRVHLMRKISDYFDLYLQP